MAFAINGRTICGMRGAKGQISSLLRVEGSAAPFEAEICCALKLIGARENATSATKYTTLEGTPSGVLNCASSLPSETLIATLGGISAPNAMHSSQDECTVARVCGWWGACAGLGATRASLGPNSAADKGGACAGAELAREMVVAGSGAGTGCGAAAGLISAADKDGASAGGAGLARGMAVAASGASTGAGVAAELISSADKDGACAGAELARAKAVAASGASTGAGARAELYCRMVALITADGAGASSEDGARAGWPVGAAEMAASGARAGAFVGAGTRGVVDVVWAA